MDETNNSLPPEWSKDGIRKEELPWSISGFRYIDNNGDDILSKEELINAYKAFDIQDRGKTWSDSYYDALADGNISSANLDNDAKTISFGEAMFDAHGHEVNEANAGKNEEELERLRNNMNLNDFKTKYGQDAYLQLARYDTNQDGVLTKYEVAQAQQNQPIPDNIKQLGFPESSTIETVVSSFNKIDLNKDGFLEVDEIVKNGTTLLKAREAIKSIELGYNNKVSLGEVAYAINGNKDIDLTTLKDENNKTKLLEYDLNKYGTITKDEIRQHDKELERAKDNKGLSTGAIVGIVLGAVILIGLIVCLIVYFSRKKKNNAKENVKNKMVFDKNNNEANYTILFNKIASQFIN